MSRHYRRFDDEPASGRGSRVGLGIGAVLLGTAMGVGIGMLAAPEAGTRTRRRLRRRLAEFGSELGEGLGGVQEFGGRARESMRSRLAQLRAREALLEDLDEDEDEEEDGEGSAFGTFLAVAAGVAATYFLSSERAAPARARARDAAVDIRRRAGDRWERFQQERGANGQPGDLHESQSETMENTESSGESPRGS
jgi:hypothetical protein